MTTSTAPLTYRQRLARWNRAIARARLLTARLRLKRNKRKRARIVAAARWGAANQPRIHYAETRPFPVQTAGTLPRLPVTLDCSAFVEVCYRAAASPDPSRENWSGQGFTGTLLEHGKNVNRPEPGDVVVYGKAPGHHAALVVKAGDDPLTVSHGSENGPLLITVSQEQQYQPPGLTFLRFPV